MHTKCEMVCTCLPEAMLISSTALTMTWMAPSLTALKPFGPVLVLSNLCKLPADLYRGTSSFLGGVADKENKIGLHLSPLQFVIKKKNVHQHYILCRFECPRQVSKEFWSWHPRLLQLTQAWGRFGKRRRRIRLWWWISIKLQARKIRVSSRS